MTQCLVVSEFPGALGSYGLLALGLMPVSMSFVMETCCSSGDLTGSDVPYATWSR